MSLCMFMNFCGSYGSLWVFIGLNASLFVLIGSYRSRCVLMDSNGSLWVCICLCSSLWILLGPNGSLWASASISRTLWGFQLIIIRTILAKFCEFRLHCLCVAIAHLMQFFFRIKPFKK